MHFSWSINGRGSSVIAEAGQLLMHIPHRLQSVSEIATFEIFLAYLKG
jgi:hypothetical protein